MATAKRVAHYLFMFFYSLSLFALYVSGCKSARWFQFHSSVLSRSLLMFGVRVMVMDVYLFSTRAHYKVSIFVFFPSLSHWLLFCFHSPCYCRLEVRKTNSHSCDAAQQHGELIQWRRSLLMSRECTAHRNVHLMTRLMRLSFFCNNKQNRARELKSSLECVYDTRLNHVGNNS